MNDKELNLKYNQNIAFYMVGIKSRAKKNGITACFACQSKNNDLQYIRSQVTGILKLFKCKCIVTEVNRINTELYSKIYDIDIASAVNAVQRHEKTEIIDKIKSFFVSG